MSDVRLLAHHEVESFHHNGFLSLPAITTADELAWLREVYDRLFDERVGWDDGAQFDLGGDESDDKLRIPQLISPSKYVPELLDTEFHRNAASIARQVFGDDLADDGSEFSDHMIFKAPHSDAETPWHQDQAYHDPSQFFRNINFWMPLDDASLDNGCMQFVPQSHTWDVLEHRPIGGDARVHGLEVVDGQRFHERSVACPIPAGGATMHAAYMLHYTGPNRTDQPRRAYILVFRAVTTEREEPIDAPWQQARETAGDKRREARAGQT